jgi:hypothetical protein
MAAFPDEELRRGYETAGGLQVFTSPTKKLYVREKAQNVVRRWFFQGRFGRPGAWPSQEPPQRMRLSGTR